MGEHLVEVDGVVTFQSDKYEWARPGFVPLKLADPTAWEPLWRYAQVRRAKDAGFSDDLEHVLRLRGYLPSAPSSEVEAAERRAYEEGWQDAKANRRHLYLQPTLADVPRFHGRALTLHGQVLIEPPPGIIHIEMSRRLDNGQSETSEFVYSTWVEVLDEWRRHNVSENMDGTVMRYWREETVAAVLVPPQLSAKAEPDEPTTAVESPQAKRASSHPPDRPICGHCGDPACWLGNECQGRVRSRYEFERAERAKGSAGACPLCHGMKMLPCFMDAPGGPRCACGRPSVRESGECLVEHGAVPCPRCGSAPARIALDTKLPVWRVRYREKARERRRCTRFVNATHATEAWERAETFGDVGEREQADPVSPEQIAVWEQLAPLTPSAVCGRCNGTKRVCACEAVAEIDYKHGMHAVGCDSIPRVLCPICMAGQQDTLPLMGFNWVCDPCLGDESTKSIGVIAWPSHCQCCGSFALGPKTARPVSPEQLQRIRQRVLEAPRAGG